MENKPTTTPQNGRLIGIRNSLKEQNTRLRVCAEQLQIILEEINGPYPDPPEKQDAIDPSNSLSDALEFEVSFMQRNNTRLELYLGVLAVLLSDTEKNEYSKKDGRGQ